MLVKVQLDTMDEQDRDDEFDNERDDWQDELRGQGLAVLTAEGLFLAGICGIAVVSVVLLFAVEVWRILTDG